MSELIPLENVSAGDLFAGDDDKKLLALVISITAQAKKLTDNLDVSDPDDRKEIASVAYKVARSKTTIDDAGKDLVSGLKAKAKVIDERRKHARDQLDALKDKIRKPLNDWEAKEQKRIDEHTNTIEYMRQNSNWCVENWQTADMDDLTGMKTVIEAIDPSKFDEFAENAEETRLASLAKIDTAIRKREDYDRDQAELEKLRKEAAEREAKEAAERAEREQKEREEQIAKEAAERAVREAERKAQEELMKERQAREHAEQVAAQAERERQLAEERAEREAKEAAEEQARRERNRQHKGKIHSAIASRLEEVGKLSPATSKKLVTAIAKGEIPFLKIEY